MIEHVISTLLSVGCSDNILLNAFVSARLTQLGLPFRMEDVPTVNWDKFLLDVAQLSVDPDCGGRLVEVGNYRL